MDKKDKKLLSESDIKAKFITPAIIAAGWDEMTQIRREVTLTPGPVIVRGELSSRNRKKRKFADYVLYYENIGTPGGGSLIKFKGRKTDFAKNTVPHFDAGSFELFRSMFELIESKCSDSHPEIAYPNEQHENRPQV